MTRASVRIQCEQLSLLSPTYICWLSCCPHHSFLHVPLHETSTARVYNHLLHDAWWWEGGGETNVFCRNKHHRRTPRCHDATYNALCVCQWVHRGERPREGVDLLLAKDRTFIFQQAVTDDTKGFDALFNIITGSKQF